MTESFDIVIIGAGPAGLSAAANAARKNLLYLLIERAEIGNTIFDYQLRKHVMAEPSRLSLRSEIPFKAGSRESILSAWQSTIDSLRINYRKADVSCIKKEGEFFLIKTDKFECKSSKVILAIGMQGSPRRLGVEGDQLPIVSYTLADPDAFVNKSIIVVGAGDAAIENALAVAERNQVYIVNRGGEFARAKDANTAAILEAIASGKVKAFLDTTVAAVTSESITLDTPDGDITIPCQQIIARLGCIMPRKFLEACGLTFGSEDPNAPPSVDANYESAVPGLFVLGALIGYPLIKQAINQGHEVIQYLIGEPLAPADQELIVEKLAALKGDINSNLEFIRENLPLFASLSVPQFRELISESTLHTPKVNQIVFNRNDYTDTFFSVVQGNVSIVLPDGKEISIPQGNFFGEMGLISGRRRSATVKAGADCILLETPRKQMIKLISSVREVKKLIDRCFIQRALETTFFPEADREDLSELTDKVKQQIVKKGQVIFKEGDAADNLYFVRKGSVKISRKDKQGEDVVQTYLPAGSIFGEMAVIDGSPRSATVTAAVQSELLSLDKDTANAFFAENPKVLESIAKLADTRRIENLLNIQDEDRGELLDFIFKEGLSDAENVLTINSDLCVSCDNCEAACAATHSGYSRLDRKGGKSFASLQIPISCRHCENPLCMIDCPPDALTRKANGEVVIRDSCIGCGNCVRNCPYGVIQLVHDDKATGWKSLFSWFKSDTGEQGAAKAAKCDLCEGLTGGPACVRACPTGAAFRANPSVLLKQIGRA
jgi:CRP-like cAMP-binding protein/thioredoxin reductase/Fe-S-cluster-containing hydrogenase component 2